jgi:inositol transport system permease protein
MRSAALDERKKGVGNTWDIYRRYGIVFILVVLFILSALINRNFLKPPNLINILKQITPIAIIGCGETILLISGLIDLSAGQLCAFTSVLAAETLVLTGSVILAFAVALLVGVIVEYLNGVLVTVFKLPSFIATLAMMNVINGALFLHTRGAAVTGIEKLRWLGQGDILRIPYMVVFMLAVVAIIQFVLKGSKFGLYMYAIGGNEKASIGAGISVNRNKRLTFALSGALVGLAGIGLAARMMSGQPTVGPGYEFDGITASIVGGTGFTGGVGTAPGVLVGSVIIGLITNILNLMNVQSEWQAVAKGSLIAIAVALDIKTKDVRGSR